MADSDLQEILENWSIAKEIREKFHEEEVTLESFLCMTEETLRTIVPKAGPRSLILSKLEKLKVTYQQNAVSGNSGSTEHEPSNENFLPMITSSPSTNIMLGTRTEDDSGIVREVLDTSGTATLHTPGTSTLHTSGTATLHTSGTATLHTSGTGTLHTLGTIVDISAILKNHALGAGLLTSTVLDQSKRKLLVDVLANDMLVKIGKPTKNDYLNYGRSVMKQFPAEQVATYYIPSDKQSTPYGKLYFKVVNLIGKQRKLGLLEDTNKKSKTCRKRIFYSCESSLEDDTETLEEMKQWLHSFQNPPVKVTEYWKKTSKTRLNFIHGDTMIDLKTILNEWPRYSDKNGFSLIDYDFEILYASSCEKMATVWPHLSKAVCQKLRAVKSKDSVISEMLKRLKSEAELSDDIKNVLAIILLPLLLPESSVTVKTEAKGKKRRVWKPTLLESMEHFVDIQKPGLDLINYLENKASKMTTYGLCLQPHVVVLCENVQQLGLMGSTVCYAVVQGKTFYEASSVLEAVDIALKSTFVFNLQFPRAANGAWSFIQKGVYDITTAYDVFSSKVYELLSDAC